MEEYLVPTRDAQDEFVEKRSRFIGYLFHTPTEEEAVARIKEMREKHWDATHNVYASIIHKGPTRFSDDGEPGGTAGMPTLQVLQREGLEDVCCVVTRYFGGILLGAGGLTRAYGGTAKLALNAAGISRMRLWATLAVPCTYSLYERVKLLVEGEGGLISGTDFGADVVLTVLLPAERTAALQEKLTELSAGQIELLAEEESFRPGPREEAR